jgi:hypothetical protein
VKVFLASPWHPVNRIARRQTKDGNDGFKSVIKKTKGMKKRKKQQLTGDYEGPVMVQVMN